MTKVEELAEKYATIERSDGEGGIDITSYVAFIDGYHQAEKDNALTWEDIKKIGDLFQDVARDSRANKDLDASFKKNLDAPFKEILRRFLEYKRGKA